MHETKVNVEVYIKVYGTISHYFSTHLGAFTVREYKELGVMRNEKKERKHGLVIFTCNYVIKEVGLWGRQKHYLALVEVLSILRTAWAMASRSIP